MRQVEVAEVSTEIAASPEQVWDVLTDFASYPEWSAYIRTLEGDLAGADLRVVLDFPSHRDFRARLLAATAGSRLAWAAGASWLPKAVLGGAHEFVLTALPDGRTTFSHREHFTGVLAGQLKKTMRGADEAFERFNLALKDRVEKLAGGDDTHST